MIRYLAGLLLGIVLGVVAAAALLAERWRARSRFGVADGLPPGSFVVLRPLLRPHQGLGHAAAHLVVGEDVKQQVDVVFGTHNTHRVLDLLDHAELARRIETPVCLDESIVSIRTARDAIDLGAAGRDDQFGHGLIDADEVTHWAVAAEASSTWAAPRVPEITAQSNRRLIEQLQNEVRQLREDVRQAGELP